MWLKLDSVPGVAVLRRGEFEGSEARSEQSLGRRLIRRVDMRDLMGVGGFEFSPPDWTCHHHCCFNQSFGRSGTVLDTLLGTI